MDYWGLEVDDSCDWPLGGPHQRVKNKITFKFAYKYAYTLTLNVQCTCKYDYTCLQPCMLISNIFTGVLTKAGRETIGSVPGGGGKGRGNRCFELEHLSEFRDKLKMR
jgi:hypothetical protein